MNLNWDIARCTGDNEAGICKIRSECLRYTERHNCSPVTAHFEAPIDCDLDSGCELIITHKDNDY